MAISKTQPMRPAEIQLVDTVNEHSDTLVSHTNSIAELTEGLADEISDRETADTELGNRIDVEMLERQAEDESLSNRINNEVTARQNADTALGLRIDNEATARQNADTNLETRIDSEGTTRQNADMALGVRIDNEAIARQNADATIQAQIGEGFSAETTIAQSLSATNQNVLLLTQDVNALENTTVPGIDTRLSTVENTTIPALSTRVSAVEDEFGYYKRGISNVITVPANNSISDSVVFATPFAAAAQCGVFPCVITTELSTLFELTVIDCTYSGFSFQVTNSDADSHDIYIGYVAVVFDIPQEG